MLLGRGMILFDSVSAWCLGELDTPAGIEWATAHSCCELLGSKNLCISISFANAIYLLLPTCESIGSVEPSSQLSLRLHDLALQDGVLDDPLTILRPYSRKPDALSSLFLLPSFNFPLHTHSVLFTFCTDSPVPILHFSIRISNHISNVFSLTNCVAAPVNHDIGRELMASDMTDEIDADPAWPLIMHISIQPQRPEMALKLSLQQGRGLSAASVAGALGAH